MCEIQKSDIIETDQNVLRMFGEIMPKIYANNNAIAFSLRMSKVLIFLKSIVSPLGYLLVAISKFIDKKLAARQTKVSIEEISKALEITTPNSHPGVRVSDRPASFCSVAHHSRDSNPREQPGRAHVDPWSLPGDPGVAG